MTHYNQYMNWYNDISDDFLPKDLNNYKKVPATFSPGQRIGWWFMDDKKFAKEEGLICPSHDPPFRGVVVPCPGIEFTGTCFDSQDALVVEYYAPVEKCYPEVVYFALRRLLDNPELDQVISLECSLAL